MRALHKAVAAAFLMAFAVTPLVLGLSGCAQQTKDSMPSQAELPPLRDVGLKQLWERRIGLDPDERVRKAWRVGDSVYVTTTQSRIVRIDVKTGVLAWSNTLGRENFEIYRPVELAAAQGPSTDVLVVTRGSAFTFNKLSGNLIRTSDFGFTVSTDPIVIGNILCVGGNNFFRGVYLDRPSSRRWNVSSPGDVFESSPVAVEDNIITVSQRGHLWRITAASGDWDWKDRQTNGPVLAGLVADTRAVYVPCMDQRVYAFSVDTGSELWEQQLPGVLDQAAALGGPVVMVLSRNRGLSALDRVHGEFKWEVPGVTQIGTVDGDHVWVGDDAGNLKSLLLATGEVLATAAVLDAQLFVRNTYDDQVILINRAGQVGLYAPNK